MATLTYERATELLHYCPDTGVFTRKVSLSNSVKVGDVAGCANKKGYICISVDGKQYLAHRLAWLITYGDWPNGSIDHINRVKTDNRLANLRIVTPSENNQNKAEGMANNTSGLLRVSWMSRARKWRAQIQVDGRVTYLGLYADRNAAHEAYVTAKRKLHAGCVI